MECGEKGSSAVKQTGARKIVVVGTSAGGLEALDQLVGQLPTDLPASLFLVQHMAAHNSGEPLLRRLSRHQALRPKLAKDKERFKPGCIYIAPPDISCSRQITCWSLRGLARTDTDQPSIHCFARPLWRMGHASSASC
jgi:chemotaxis response regulator CheB